MRHRRKSPVEDFLDIIVVIIKSPYGYIGGLVVTVIFILISEIFLVPSVSTETSTISSVFSPLYSMFQNIFRGMAAISFFATIISFIIHSFFRD